MMETSQKKTSFPPASLGKKEKIKYSLRSGIQKGWDGFVWMLRILVPVSFFTVLLEYSGWLNKADFLLEPVMGLLHLPSIAALPLIAGMLTGIYGGVASMVVLPLSHEHMTLIAIFLLISHNLIQESIIQGKSGMNPFIAAGLRLFASVITVMVVSRFLMPESFVPESSVSVVSPLSAPAALPLSAVLKNWCFGTFLLCLKIFGIIMVLMMLLSIMKAFNWIHHIVNALNPLLRAMGLNRRVGILWLTANIFGIAYGAAVIIEEAKEGHLTAEELNRLHLSIGINHAMFEDPGLFLPLGLNPFWLWIPRLLVAVIAVHLLGLWYLFRHKKADEAVTVGENG